MEYAANVRPVRVMCTGRIDPTFILKAFAGAAGGAGGADGVLVAGCHPGDCHYLGGNYKTIRRTAMVRRMLEQFGIEPERFRLEWVSAGEGTKWAHIAREMTEQIKALGPLQWWQNVKQA
jgi:F420-non-reducing hydrogenase iron-sulfur subunit